MRTLVGWIAGIFALGLALGGLYGGSLAVEAEPSISDLPSVDCGEGKEALFAPVMSNGTTKLRVKCVPIAAEHTRQVAAPVFAAAPAPAPVTAPIAPAPVANVIHEGDDEPAPTVPQEHDSRSWKDSALIIGSSAGAGAGIGALAKGKKGAIVGAAVGGVAGTVYDLSTRNKK